MSLFDFLYLITTEYDFVETLRLVFYLLILLPIITYIVTHMTVSAFFRAKYTILARIVAGEAKKC